MEHKKLRTIICECSKVVSVRALLRHLRSKEDGHSHSYISECEKLIGMARIKKYAWKISEGSEALRDDHWCAHVLSGELSLGEITFDTPRPLGQNTQKVLEQLTLGRRGKGNPSLLNKPIYNLEKIKKFASDLFIQLSDDPRRFVKLQNALRSKFPDYGYSFVEMFPKNGDKRGHNRQNSILSFLIAKPIEWIVSQKSLDRGKLISIGQLKSPNLVKMANAGRKSLRGHVTIPHNALFNMVLSLDKNAKKEKQIDYNSTWKSYDIFSPSKNILIEMHGRVWHDLNACKPNMIPLVTENVENDKIKEELAKKNGYILHIFWDDQCDIWESKLEEIYGKRSKSYEQALREELDKKRKRGSL